MSSSEPNLACHPHVCCLCFSPCANVFFFSSPLFARRWRLRARRQSVCAMGTVWAAGDPAPAPFSCYALTTSRGAHAATSVGDHADADVSDCAFPSDLLAAAPSVESTWTTSSADAVPLATGDGLLPTPPFGDAAPTPVALSPAPTGRLSPAPSLPPGDAASFDDDGDDALLLLMGGCRGNRNAWFSFDDLASAVRIVDPDDDGPSGAVDVCDAPTTTTTATAATRAAGDDDTVGTTAASVRAATICAPAAVAVGAACTPV